MAGWIVLGIIILIASSFSFKEADYFEIELTTERETPKVQF